MHQCFIPFNTATLIFYRYRYAIHPGWTFGLLCHFWTYRKTENRDEHSFSHTPDSATESGLERDQQGVLSGAWKEGLASSICRWWPWEAWPPQGSPWGMLPASFWSWPCWTILICCHACIGCQGTLCIFEDGLWTTWHFTPQLLSSQGRMCIVKNPFPTVISCHLHLPTIVTFPKGSKFFSHRSFA